MLFARSDWLVRKWIASIFYPRATDETIASQEFDFIPFSVCRHKWAIFLVSVWYILKKNYLHITVGENIKQRLKDFFLRKKKIKSFHSGLAILLGFFFRCSQRVISGSLPLRLKCACSTELWRILVESQKNLFLWIPFPSPPPFSLAVNWQSIFYSTPHDTLLVTTNPPLRPWKLCDLPKKCPTTPLRKCIMTLPQVLSILGLLTHKYLP